MTRPDHRKHPLRHRWRWWLEAVLLVAIGAGVLGGCTTLSYYSHLAVGEAGVLLKRQPIREVVADPDTPAELRQRLQLALKARAFASGVLKLPRNKSYTLYADIGRPFVMYNVFATPELSLKPVEHCFLIAGCVAYQGFYHLDRAKALAAKLRKAGDDVYIGGVPAYSTLGHFADPILSSMNRWSTDELIGTIFHELAHQKLYVKGDTAFNESFATFVQREGLREWHEANHLPPPGPTQARRQRQFTQLVLATRKTLKAVYASPLPDAEKRQRKQETFAQLRRQYRHLRDSQWHGRGDYDHWISTPINNAKLLPFGLYDQYVDAFAALFEQCGQQWKPFYTRVRAVSRQDAEHRRAFLNGKRSAAPSTH
ncbi:MAG TPA: aminopeptidase [Oleiagrimonas sp.]|nr:aminopeptidase [Oleiagrimonas sp.]